MIEVDAPFCIVAILSHNTHTHVCIFKLSMCTWVIFIVLSWVISASGHSILQMRLHVSLWPDRETLKVCTHRICQILPYVTNLLRGN